MYECPINIIMSDIETQFDQEVPKAVQRCGILVDKDELVKALDYDRKQYEKGYADAKSEQPEIIRCKDCKHYQFADNRAFGMPVKMCEWFGFEDVGDDDFCSRAERRSDG